MGVVQLEQERSAADGEEYGMRAGVEEDQGKHAVAGAHLHEVST